MGRCSTSAANMNKWQKLESRKQAANGRNWVGLTFRLKHRWWWRRFLNIDGYRAAILYE